MCNGAQKDHCCIDLLEDPLIRLVMESDGVSEQEITALMERVRQAMLSDTRTKAYGSAPRAPSAAFWQAGAPPSLDSD
jgi:hypothetical protein